MSDRKRDPLLPVIFLCFLAAAFGLSRVTVALVDSQAHKKDHCVGDAHCLSDSDCVEGFVCKKEISCRPAMICIPSTCGNAECGRNAAGKMCGECDSDKTCCKGKCLDHSDLDIESLESRRSSGTQTTMDATNESAERGADAGGEE